MKDEPLPVGRDLVEFDRRDVPIFRESPSLWTEAGVDAVAYGAPLDRVFGMPSETHVAGQIPPQEVALPILEDPLVELGTLSDTLALADVPLGLLDAALGHASPVLAPLHDVWSGDNLGSDWTFDL